MKNANSVGSLAVFPTGIFIHAALQTSVNTVDARCCPTRMSYSVPHLHAACLNVGGPHVWGGRHTDGTRRKNLAIITETLY